MIDPAEMLERLAAVAEVRSWIGTPYLPGGRIKGVGCDCVTFIAESAIACGMLKEAEIEVYSPDWWCHAKDDLYLLRLLRHAAKLAVGKTYMTLSPAPANLLLARVDGSQVFNHGGVVTEWPMLVHSVFPRVEEVNAMQHVMWAHQDVVILDGWAKKRESTC